MSSITQKSEHQLLIKSIEIVHMARFTTDDFLLKKKCNDWLALLDQHINNAKQGVA